MKRLPGAQGIVLSDVQVSLQDLLALLEVKGGTGSFDLSSAIVPVVNVGELLERRSAGQFGGLGVLSDPMRGFIWLLGAPITINAAINNAIDFTSFQGLVTGFINAAEQRLRVKQTFIQAEFTVADQIVQVSFIYMLADGVTILEHLTPNEAIAPQGPLAAHQTLINRLPNQRLERQTDTTDISLGVKFTSQGTLGGANVITLRPRILLRVEPR